MPDLVRCSFVIEGPRRPSGVVLWRRSCKRRTPKTGPYSYCWQHIKADSGTLAIEGLTDAESVKFLVAIGWDGDDA